MRAKFGKKPGRGKEGVDISQIKAYLERLRRARELLELDERASLREVKEAYRNLARRWHPDRVDDGRQAEAEEMMKALNEAYALLVAYCEGYPIPLDQEAVRQVDPFYDHLRRFYHEYFQDQEPGQEKKPRR
jgi:hypothetical protein